VTFVVYGRLVSIPGYMVWCAVGYALIGSGLTWLVGRPLIGLNALRQTREADFRFALVRVSESAESISLYGGEADERRALGLSLGPVIAAMRRLSGSVARLTWITSAYGFLAIVVPVLVAAPGYFGGRLTLGELMMVVGAFGYMQNALRWFVDNFARLADWRAALGRVAAFWEAVTGRTRRRRARSGWSSSPTRRAASRSSASASC
jgi:putative ATP-binding cassette transporter